jgi:hypothetical protein
LLDFKGHFLFPRYGVDDVFRGPEDEGFPDCFLEVLSAISVKSNIPEIQYGTRCVILWCLTILL